MTDTDDAEGLREALKASLSKRSQAVMDPPWTAAFNAALDMVARDMAPYLAKPVEPAAPAVSGDDAREAIARRAENAVLGMRHGCSVSIIGDSGRFYRTLADAILADPACRLAPAGDGERVRHDCPACAWQARDIGAVLHNLVGQLERGTSILDARAMRKLASAKEALARWEPIRDAHFAALDAAR